MLCMDLKISECSSVGNESLVKAHPFQRSEQDVGQWVLCFDMTGRDMRLRPSPLPHQRDQAPESVTTGVLMWEGERGGGGGSGPPK